MPSKQVHNKIAKLLGGNTRVNTVIDLPFRFLGRGHRKLYHTDQEQILIGWMIDGARGALVGLAHGKIDRLGSSNRVLRNLMEIAVAEKEKPRRKATRIS